MPKFLKPAPAQGLTLVGARTFRRDWAVEYYGMRSPRSPPRKSAPFAQIWHRSGEGGYQGFRELLHPGKKKPRCTPDCGLDCEVGEVRERSPKQTPPRGLCVRHTGRTNNATQSRAQPKGAASRSSKFSPEISQAGRVVFRPLAGTACYESRSEHYRCTSTSGDLSDGSLAATLIAAARAQQ